jgi:hypothetical protein
MILHVQVSEEEKATYVESAYEARMKLSEWVRIVLNESALGVEVVRPAIKIEQPKMIASTIDELKASGAVIMGNDLPSQPQWTLNDSPKVKEAREALFGKNPHRRMSSLESDFNKLAHLPFQKFHENGKPKYDSRENPIEY